MSKGPFDSYFSEPTNSTDPTEIPFDSCFSWISGPTNQTCFGPGWIRGIRGIFLLFFLLIQLDFNYCPNTKYLNGTKAVSRLTRLRHGTVYV